MNAVVFERVQSRLAVCVNGDGLVCCLYGFHVL